MFKDFLLWLEERHIGILTTIALHLLMVTVFLMVKIKTYSEREYSIMLDMSQLQAYMDEIVLEEQPQVNDQEYVQTLQQQHSIRTIPVNVAEERAAQSIEKMIRDIKAEENITDPPPQDTPEEIAAQEKQLRENEARIYDDRFPVDNVGERTIYRGETTVSYDLAGRRHMSMPPPVYKCRIAGKIVVNIAVNGNGYVIEAKINTSQSNSNDPCLVQAAQRDAERSRFDRSSLARQNGTITYIFQSQ